MGQRKLLRQVQTSLTRMVHEFAFTNEKLLPESDKQILRAMHHELTTAESVDMSFKVDTKSGKVIVQCNEIQYKFDDPSLKEDKG